MSANKDIMENLVRKLLSREKQGLEGTIINHSQNIMPQLQNLYTLIRMYNDELATYSLVGDMEVNPGFIPAISAISSAIDDMREYIDKIKDEYPQSDEVDPLTEGDNFA